MLFQEVDVSASPLTQDMDVPPTTVVSLSDNCIPPQSQLSHSHFHTQQLNHMDDLTMRASLGRADGSRTGSGKFGESPVVACQTSAVTVKDEPEDKEEKKIVIDLTPRSDIHQAHPAVPMHGPTVHGLQYPPSSACANSLVGEDRSSPAGNIPTHLHSTDDGYSDSEASSQDGLNKSAANKNDMMSGIFRFSVNKNPEAPLTQPRAKREFVPENKKDESYWNKRHKNNISARRSRMKRKNMEKEMERRSFELEQENIKLKYELRALKRMLGREKLNTDVASSPSGSPVSSPSSGVGMSNSNLSSAGSAEHSTSSSPDLNAEEDKSLKTSLEVNPTHIPKEYDDFREGSECQDNQSQRCSQPTVSRLSPPTAHSQNYSSPGIYLNVPNHETFSSLPPAAHSSFSRTPLSFMADVSAWQEFDKHYGSSFQLPAQRNSVPSSPQFPSHGVPTSHFPSHGDSVSARSQFPSQRDSVPPSSQLSSHQDSVPASSQFPSHQDYPPASSQLSSHEDFVPPSSQFPSYRDSVPPSALLSYQSQRDCVSPSSQFSSRSDSVPPSFLLPSQCQGDAVPASYWVSPDGVLTIEDSSSASSSPVKKRSFCDVYEECLRCVPPKKRRFIQSASNQAKVVDKEDCITKRSLSQ